MVPVAYRHIFLFKLLRSLLVVEGIYFCKIISKIVGHIMHVYFTVDLSALGRVFEFRTPALTNTLLLSVQGHRASR